MHKMSTKTHKNSIEKVQYNPAVDIENEPTKYESSDQKGIPPLPDMEIEKENRLSKIMSLHSKGLNQEEIARKLEVNQSTISRDLKFIKEQAKSQIDTYFRKDILFEFTRYLKGSDEIIKELWEVVDLSFDEPKDRMNALKLLIQAYEKRHQTVIGGPASYLDIKKTESDLDYQAFVESDPERKAISTMQRLYPTKNNFAGDYFNSKLK